MRDTHIGILVALAVILGDALVVDTLLVGLALQNRRN
jgi:hypothetical protein